MSTNVNSTNSNAASSLKYERTQNRDIVGTIERLNRSQQFIPLSEKILNSISASIYDYAIKEFKQQWRNNHETHENPPGFKVSVSIGSPIYKKVPDSQSFYYVMMVVTSFLMECKPNEGETDVEAETRMRASFSEKISQVLNAKITENMTSSLPEGSADMFSFALNGRNAKKDQEQNNQGKIGRKPEIGKINLMFMTDFRSKKADMISKDIFPYRDSEGIHSGLVSNMALAVDRIKEAEQVK